MNEIFVGRSEEDGFFIDDVEVVKGDERKTVEHGSLRYHYIPMSDGEKLALGIPVHKKISWKIETLGELEKKEV